MTNEVKQQGHFRTLDGVRLFYSVEGPADAPPLLFCYGLVCSKLQWKYQMEYFKKNYRIIYMDYRGHGQSESPQDASTVTIQNLARDLLQLLDELQIDSLPVLGHSLGVNIILDLYRLAPKRVSALVLANGTPKDPFETMFHHNFLQVFFPVIHKIHAFFPELLQKFWASQGNNFINQEFIALAGFNTKYAKKEDINEYLRITSQVPLAVFLNLLSDFMKYDSNHWLHEIKVPTLILAGEKDLITPAMNQKIFHELIPGSILEEIPEGSHCPQMEKIDLVNSILENFLATIHKPKNTTATKTKKKKSAQLREKSLS